MSDRPILFSAPMVRALIEGRKTQTRRVLKPQPPKNEDFPGSHFGMSRCVADDVKMYSENEYERLPKHPTDWEIVGAVGVARDAGFPKRYRTPYAVGDRLWVRERWGVIQAYDDLSPREIGARHFYDGRYHGSVGYSTDDIGRWCQTGCNGAAGRWRPSIHMPRWAARLTLTVTDVRVQRVQEISNEDAKAEGVHYWEWPGFRSCDCDSADCVWCAHYPSQYRPAYRDLWDSLNAKHPWDCNPWVVALTFTVAQQNIDRLEVS